MDDQGDGRTARLDDAEWGLGSDMCTEGLGLRWRRAGDYFDIHRIPALFVLAGLFCFTLTQKWARERTLAGCSSLLPYP